MSWIKELLDDIDFAEFELEMADFEEITYTEQEMDELYQKFLGDN